MKYLNCLTLIGIIFTIVSWIREGSVDDDAPKYRIGVRDNVEILMPGRDENGKEWQYLDLIFHVEIPVLGYDESLERLYTTHDYYNHEVKVIFADNIDKTAFREVFFYREDFQKSMKNFQSRIKEVATEEGWVWTEKTKSVNVPSEIRCKDLY